MPTNDYLNSNLKSLIAKVHDEDEGIEKANKKAQQVMAQAKRQSPSYRDTSVLKIITLKNE